MAVEDEQPEAQRMRIAERRLLDAVRRLHRSAPAEPDVRADAVLARLRAAPTPGRSHRGGTPLTLTDGEWLAVVDRLLADGRLRQRGHRLRLPDHNPQFGPAMRRRADLVVGELRAAGLAPPRAEVVARRHGLPVALLDAMRASGELIALGPGVDLTDDIYRQAQRRIDALPRGERRPGEVARAIGSSRRIASALLSANSQAGAPRRASASSAVGSSSPAARRASR